MESKVIKNGRQHVFSKIIARLSYVEEFVERMSVEAPDSQLTLLFKLGNSYQEETDSEVLKPKLKIYLKKLLGPMTDFGLFYNQDIGSIFIAGPYTSIFIQEVDGKKLGAMSEGVYGILKGFGLNDWETSHAIENLMEGQFLLLGKI